MVGLGQAEAADQLAAAQPRQEALLLFRRAVHVDRRHDQPGLHAARGAAGGIHPFQLARDPAVVDEAAPGTTVALYFSAADAASAHLAPTPPVAALRPVYPAHHSPHPPPPPPP